MKMVLLGATLLALGLLAQSVEAHPVAVAVDSPLTGERCYVYEDDGTTEFWLESNGVLTGGVDSATDAAGATSDGSGLQRGPTEDDNGREIPADTLLAGATGCPL